MCVEHDEAKPPRLPDLERPEATAGMTRQGAIKMLKRFRIVGLCSVAVFALSAVAASTASAAWVTSPWEVEQSGTWKAVTSAVTVESKGTVILKNGESEFECGVTIEGKVETGGKDKVTSITYKNPCPVLKYGECKNPQPAGLPTAKPLNLPWNTQLEDESISGSMRDKITSGTIKGNPGWGVECESNFFIRVEDQCTAAEEFTTITNTTGGYKAIFSGVLNLGSVCKGLGTAEHGSIGGSIEFKLPSGSGYQGIRAG